MKHPQPRLQLRGGLWLWLWNSNGWGIFQLFKQQWVRRAALQPRDASSAVATLPEELFTKLCKLPQFSVCLTHNFRAMGYGDSSRSMEISPLPRKKVVSDWKRTLEVFWLRSSLPEPVKSALKSREVLLVFHHLWIGLLMKPSVPMHLHNGKNSSRGSLRPLLFFALCFSSFTICPPFFKWEIRSF